MKATLLVLSIAGISVAVAQQPPQAPKAGDYQAALGILNEDQTAPAAQAIPVNNKHSKRRVVPRITGDINSAPIQVEREVSIPASARFSLALSSAWIDNAPAPVLAPDGRILYTYGKGAPTIVCAMRHVCELDLEAGEVPIKDSRDLGDPRYEVTPRTAGSGPNAFTYLALKPTQAALDTTLTIGTDRRTYFIRLVSTAHDYMARVGFTYPDEEQEKKQADADAKNASVEHEKADAARLAALNTQKPIRNWNYSVKLHGRDSGYLRPQQIGDDGIHTYISLSEEARHRGLPVVRLNDARGPVPANTTWKGNQLIVDAVFERACLLEGVGRHQQRACFTNQGLKAEHGIN